MKMAISKYVPGELYLFIDSCKLCVLPYNGKKYGSMLIVHSTKMTEEQKTITLLKIYHNHLWLIWVNLKMANFLLGQQNEYTTVLSASQIVDLKMSTGLKNNGFWDLKKY